MIVGFLMPWQANDGATTAISSAVERGCEDKSSLAESEVFLERLTLGWQTSQ